MFKIYYVLILYNYTNNTNIQQKSINIFFLFFYYKSCLTAFI